MTVPVIGTGGADILLGDQDPNSVGDTNDSMRGLGGNDTLQPGGGIDTVNGGAGIDTVNYSVDSDFYGPPTEGVTINLGAGTADDPFGADGGVDTLISIENAIGTNFADDITGSSVANLLTGLDGNDVLAGGAGNDLLDGGAGDDNLQGQADDDILYGGTGADNLNGGAQNDTFWWVAGDGDDNYVGGTGVDTILSFSPTFDGLGTTFSQAATTIEVIDFAGGAGTIQGSAGTDTWDFQGITLADAGSTQINGDAGDDVIHGTDNDDGRLVGGAGNDSLYGEDGNDWVGDGGAGDAGNDSMFGGIGNDTIDGGTGADRVRGDAGDDRFNFEFGDLNLGGAIDRILAFQGAGGNSPGFDDQIYFDDGDADSDSLVLVSSNARNGLYEWRDDSGANQGHLWINNSVDDATDTSVLVAGVDYFLA